MPTNVAPNFAQHLYRYGTLYLEVRYLLVVAFYLYSSASDSKLGRSYANEL